MARLTQGYQKPDMTVSIADATAKWPDDAPRELQVEVDNYNLQGDMVVINAYGIYDQIAVSLSIDLGTFMDVTKQIEKEINHAAGKTARHA